MVQATLEDRIKRLFDRKKHAYENHDALKYYLACEELGISEENVDDPLLFRKGGEEYGLGLRDFTKYKERKGVKASLYHAFLDEIKGTDINVRKFDENPNTKKALLLKYFPERFGEGKKQNLRNYNERQIGFIFKEFVNYALNRDGEMC